MIAKLVIICILMVACMDGYRDTHQLISPNPMDDSQRIRLMNSWYGIFFQTLELSEMIIDDVDDACGGCGDDWYCNH